MADDPTAFRIHQQVAARRGPDPHPLQLSYRNEDGDRHYYDGNYHSRQRLAGADVDICFRGRIAVTAIRLF